MSSTAANASTSQFLNLPPEIRSRIYDYVFGSNPVCIVPDLEVEQKSMRIGYKILMCTCEHDRTQLSPRVRGYGHRTEPERVYTKACQNCKASAELQSSACESLSLPLLQVCRQIYHEAALKPFQQTLFTINFGKLGIYQGGRSLVGYVFPAFMNALVPAQVKVIARLRLLSASASCINYAKLTRLEGLKHLEIQVNFNFTHFYYTSRLLEGFAATPIMRSLVKLNLKSVRVELGLGESNDHDRKWAELQGITFKPPTKDDAELFEEILKRVETDSVGPRL